MLFPPTNPLLCPFPSFTDYSLEEPQRNQISLEGQHGHQRCSSESVLMEEEQPSWLEELLNEPEIQHMHKGHRRSASDSSAYLDAAVETFKMREEYKFPNLALHSPWSSQNLVHRRDPNAISFSEQYNRANEAPLNYCNAFVRDGIMLQDLGSAAINNREQVESGSQKPESSSERSDWSQAKTSTSKAEAKRAKQQSSARRSRVRKLQYIAELERNVQVMQAEESLGAAKFGFLDQQNLILVMENRSLRQRLESLSQEQLIKHLEQEMLERELVRLQIVYQLQRQQQQPQRQQQQPQRQQQKHHPKHHRRSKSRDSESGLAKNKEASSSSGTLRDLQSHFASLSLRHKGASSSCGSLHGSLCM